MSESPFLDLTQIAGLLADLKPATVRRLDELAELSRGERAIRGGVLPALALAPGASRCTGPGGLGNDRMHTEEAIVVISVRSAGHDDAAALDELHLVRTAVYTALETTVPAARFSPLRFVGGAVISLANGVLTYADRYATDCPAPVR